MKIKGNVSILVGELGIAYAESKEITEVEIIWDGSPEKGEITRGGKIVSSWDSLHQRLILHSGSIKKIKFSFPENVDDVGISTHRDSFYSFFNKLIPIFPQLHSLEELDLSSLRGDIISSITSNVDGIPPKIRVVTVTNAAVEQRNKGSSDDASISGGDEEEEEEEDAREKAKEDVEFKSDEQQAGSSLKSPASSYEDHRSPLKFTGTVADTIQALQAENADSYTELEIIYDYKEGPSLLPSLTSLIMGRRITKIALTDSNPAISYVLGLPDTVSKFIVDLFLHATLQELDLSKVHYGVLRNVFQPLNDFLKNNTSNIKIVVPKIVIDTSSLTFYPFLSKQVDVERSKAGESLTALFTPPHSAPRAHVAPPLLQGSILAAPLPAPSQADIRSPLKFTGTVKETIQALQGEDARRYTELDIRCDLQESPPLIPGLIPLIMRCRINKIALTDPTPAMLHLSGSPDPIHTLIVNLFEYPTLQELDLSKVHYDTLKRAFRYLNRYLEQNPSNITIIVPKILIDENSLGWHEHVRKRVDVARSIASDQPPVPYVPRPFTASLSRSATSAASLPAPSFASAFGSAASTTSYPPYSVGAQGHTYIPPSGSGRIPGQGANISTANVLAGRTGGTAAYSLGGSVDTGVIGRHHSPSSSRNDTNHNTLISKSLKSDLRERIERSLKLIDDYKRAFDYLPETSLKYYYEQVLISFHAIISECAAEYNAYSHDEEKLEAILKKIILYNYYFDKFDLLLRDIFNVEDTFQDKGLPVINSVRLKPASTIDIKGVSDQANDLINTVEISEQHGLATNIANFITKALLALGIPVAATGVGAYVGGVIGGVLGLSTVTFTGPAGLIVGASLGAWIGGGAGLVTGSAGGVYASSKFTFFSPIQTSLTAFAKQAVDYTEEAKFVEEAKTVASLKAAAPAA